MIDRTIATRTVLVALTLGTVCAAALAPPQAKATPTNPALVGGGLGLPMARADWKTTFSTPGSLDGWAPVTGIVRPDKSQANYGVRNVSVSDGKLRIVTQRHCVKSNSSPLTSKNARTGKCPKGKKTRYSSGRVSIAMPQYTNFKVSFRAKLPSNAVTGTRTALWMRNASPYCPDVPKDSRPTNLGELDALEWYGRTKTTSHSVTHMACKSPTKTATLQNGNTRSVSYQKWHTWSVERRGKTIRYRMDGKQIAESHVCGKGSFGKVSSSKCTAILNQPWTLIMNGEVFAKGFGKNNYASPSSKKKFPKQVLYVNWVKVHAL